VYVGVCCVRGVRCVSLLGVMDATWTCLFPPSVRLTFVCVYVRLTLVYAYVRLTLVYAYACLYRCIIIVTGYERALQFRHRKDTVFMCVPSLCVCAFIVCVCRHCVCVPSLCVCAFIVCVCLHCVCVPSLCVCVCAYNHVFLCL